MNKETFETFYSLDVSDKTEKKNNLTYLSWSWAWAEVLKVCPDSNYEVKMFDGKPYLYDEKLGYLVMTSVTIEGDTKTMWLPVMDGTNKAMFDHPYKYMSYGKEKIVAQATMFDINKTIMRCLTKNISMFGLGLYIYTGEDLPESAEQEKKSDLWEGLEEDLKPISIKDYADQFRRVVPKEAQVKILADLKLSKAEDLGQVNLIRYIDHYEKQANQ